ncbi:alpha-L-rhamnosidase-related protein [Sunxiuqinia indica]|uniref:alpha-L-rhamnosidase-related protein n=1 Tax=Sunxiuqinia indica TaxID=2692584 RepID=UPI00135CA44C|nr:alpha-L-rhamnosidase N-terminal domain-containing protein [Sunxiuqinia indica]
MRNWKKQILIFLVTLLLNPIAGFSTDSVLNQRTDWNAKWINCETNTDTINAWTIYRKTFAVEKAVKKAIANIAVDSKYWLWINGEMVVFEGGLKRGPSPEDTYYDEVDLSSYIQQGKNSIAILTWFFGKHGFAHNSSGKAGLLFELDIDGKTSVISDQSWKCIKNPAYWHSTEGTQPNYRLSESNVLYDASKEIEGWQTSGFDCSNLNNATEQGEAGCAPWNKLIKRPIPLFQDFGIQIFEKQYPFIADGDTIKCKLPYNAQITPFLDITSEAGQEIAMLTDNYLGGSAPNVRAEYITKSGDQEYESYGWMNGHELWFVIPKGVTVNKLGYRETGFNTEFAGSFECNDSFYNRLWQKSLRTLYITMRDNYMDCPDRERAQWWGDVVNEMGEAFYALDVNSHSLAKKGIYELMNWQREDGTIYSPIPAGNRDKELPMQMLNSVGYYGFWTYYWYTGDKATIEAVYPKVKKYLDVWELGEDGLVVPRKGEWPWGDWGDNKDMTILYNCWYYLACKGYALMSELMDNPTGKVWAEQQMSSIEANFNKTFWTGKEYRSSDYDKETDDRANAMAVLCGFAEPKNYHLLEEVLDEQRHASPYMEKYVLEALFKMGYPELALSRMKNRFSKMVNSEMTTLWEGWGIGKQGFGGGTINHAWSGGGLTLLSQYVAGIEPLKAGFEKIQIKPYKTQLTDVKAEVETVKGKLTVNLKYGDNGLTQQISSPVSMQLTFPYEVSQIQSILINGKELSKMKLRTYREKAFLTLPKGDYYINVIVS